MAMRDLVYREHENVKTRLGELVNQRERLKADLADLNAQIISLAVDRDEMRVWLDRQP